MRTIVESARAIIIDSHLPLTLLAEALTTMIYIKNRPPTLFTINESKVTFFQAWNLGAQPTIHQLRIFGSTIYALNDSKPNPRLATKAWMGYLVGYEGRHQYRIYNPVRHAVFIRRDVIFEEASIGPKSDKPSVNPSAARKVKLLWDFPTFVFFISFG